MLKQTVGVTSDHGGERSPAAFYCYAHADDHDESLTRLREALEVAIELHIGAAFTIFQDRRDLAWGDAWRNRIDQTLDHITFLVPVVTPSFFASPECRRELTRFFEREDALGHNDLVLPIYYISAPQMGDGPAHAPDELAERLLARQHTDFRKLRNQPLQSPQVRDELDRMASHVRDSLWADASPQTSAAPGGTARRQPARAKREPRTLVVDPAGLGDDTTISAAIQTASAGDRIVVRPGYYREGLVLDKPLHIIGDGPLEDIVVRATGGEALHFSADIGRVENLTLRQGGPGRMASRGRHRGPARAPGLRHPLRDRYRHRRPRRRRPPDPPQPGPRLQILRSLRDRPRAGSHRGQRHPQQPTPQPV